jgi:hypothetical protein
MSNEDIDTELELTNSMISYADSFIKKLLRERDYIDALIEKLRKDKEQKIAYKQAKWGIPPETDTGSKDD